MEAFQQTHYPSPAPSHSRSMTDVEGAHSGALGLDPLIDPALRAMTSDEDHYDQPQRPNILPEPLAMDIPEQPEEIPMEGVSPSLLDITTAPEQVPIPPSPQAPLQVPQEESSPVTETQVVPPPGPEPSVAGPSDPAWLQSLFQTFFDMHPPSPRKESLAMCAACQYAHVPTSFTFWFLTRFSSRREDGKADPDVYPVLGIDNNDTLFKHIQEAHEKIYNMILSGEEVEEE